MSRTTGSMKTVGEVCEALGFGENFEARFPDRKLRTLKNSARAFRLEYLKRTDLHVHQFTRDVAEDCARRYCEEEGHGEIYWHERQHGSNDNVPIYVNDKER